MPLCKLLWHMDGRDNGRVHRWYRFPCDTVSFELMIRDVGQGSVFQVLRNGYKNRTREISRRGRACGRYGCRSLLKVATIFLVCWRSCKIFERTVVLSYR